MSCLSSCLELGEVRAAGSQHLAHLRGVEDREQQMLDRQEFVARLARLVKGIVEQNSSSLTSTSDFRYASSSVHISGC